MNRPLADRIRPDKIENIVGQNHLLENSKVLRKIIDSKKLANLVFYGPPGTGKTTLANIIAQNTGVLLRKLNCTTSSTADIKEVISGIGTFSAQNGILLYLDEIQYFNKKQQQILLEFIENGLITLIVSTTENPYFYIYGALLSRMTVFEFKSVPKNEIIKALVRAINILKNDYPENLFVGEEVLAEIADYCGGDVRKALNILELSVISAETENGEKKITKKIARQFVGYNTMRYDKSGDEHYDLLSALQKSMRGSDANAALHYLARLLEAGDLPSACRRVLVCACEDVGLAYPQTVIFAKSCVDIAFQVGLPEARIPLADAVIMICNSPKSNSAYVAINNAAADVKSGNFGQIPRQMQNKHFDGADNFKKGQFYKYPHDFKNHYILQQYLPNEIKNVEYYKYGENKNEQAFKNYWELIKKV
jgi:putative ATPase